VPALSTIGLFVGAALLLLVTPGPAVLYITTRTVSQGRGAGLVSALGLSALLVSSALAFTAVKLLGAAYLISIGVMRLLDRSDASAEESLAPRRSRKALFRQGVVVNLLNPKTALFFLAFLPQFVDPARGPVALQILFFGLLFTFLGLGKDTLWALAADRVGGVFRRSSRMRSSGRYVSGGVYIGLGLVSAFAGTRK